MKCLRRVSAELRDGRCSPAFSSPRSDVLVQLLVQPLTGRDFERSAISHKLYHIARAIQNRTAMSTILKMGGHDGAETWLYFIVKIVGNLPPHFYTINFDGPFRQALPPFPSSIYVSQPRCPDAPRRTLPWSDTVTAQR